MLPTDTVALPEPSLHELRTPRSVSASLLLPVPALSLASHLTIAYDRQPKIQQSSQSEPAIQVFVALSGTG